jgi:glutamate racemase
MTSSVASVNDAPIGIFDSGVGGLTVARAVIDQLPHEQILYVGDTARGPYGPRSLAEVRQFALEIMDGLVARGVKMIVIACNTASAAVLRDARERYQVPVVEVIQPAARRAARTTRNGHIGVIGTQATITSGVYEDALSAIPDVDVESRACPSFVSFVEAGITTGPELMNDAHAYLDPLVAAGIDTLVLGCTHYPLLTGVIQYVVGEDVALVSSAEETAKDVYRVLTSSNMLRPSDAAPAKHEFLATGDPAPFAELGRRILGTAVTAEHVSFGALR